MLEHGGKLREAAARHGRPLAEWLDLSTGINPRWYPAPPLDPAIWHRLPEEDPALAAAARAYYGAPAVLPVAGTQAAIQALPRMRTACRVVVSAPSYAEHAHAWRSAGHDVHEVAFDDLARQADMADVMVVINPNNPTGAVVPPASLLEWHARLQRRGGWLVVDEAFGDTAPELSVAAETGREGLIVLRSVGKFFGLAGLRLGFVAARPDLLSRLADCLGPWSVSAAAQRIGTAALGDRAWQQAECSRLQGEGKRLHALLGRHGIPSSGTALFRWWPETQPEAFRELMARHGIWVRYFGEAGRGIRLGLPGDEEGWERLERALADWTQRKETR